MRWFKRKPKEFDYAAIRVGNVYVLPPTEEDVREFRQKRRRELTRRGFLLGGVAAALGALTIPFWPRGGQAVTADQLLPRLEEARANPSWLKQILLSYYQNDDPEIRRICIAHMIAFAKERDGDICRALWDRIYNDTLLDNRKAALDVLLFCGRQADVRALVKLHGKAGWARQIIDRTLEFTNFRSLREALPGR